MFCFLTKFYDPKEHGFCCMPLLSVWILKPRQLASVCSYK